MEKTKHVQCVPADMVDRLKQLLVRLWETKNPAAHSLSAVLSDFEPDTRVLSAAILDVSIKERAIALKENEKNYAAEKEKLQAELERLSEEVRASAAMRVEKIKASFVCEKAELEKELKEKRQELEKEFAVRSARQAEELALKEQHLASTHGKVKELEKRVAGLSDAHHAELMDKVREKESDFRLRLEEFGKEKAATMKAVEDIKARLDGEKGVWEAERERIKAELEREYAARREALAGGLRGKEAELNREAAERIDFERATWEAQNKRQETVLAKTAEDFKKAQKEIENLAAENRRAGESLVEKESEAERRLIEAKSEFERESARRVKEAVESKTGRLAEALKSAEKKSEEAAAEAARTKEESVRLNADLLERVRQSEARIAREGEEAVGRRAAELEGAYKEKKAQLEASLASVKAELEKEFTKRSARQAAELEAKEQYLGSAQEKVKELERELAGSNDAHHAELMLKMREKESEFRSRLEEFNKEKSAYVKCIEELKSNFESEKQGMESERERVKVELAGRYAELEAGLNASAGKRTAELEREYAARREALAGELRGKEAELNREAAERIDFERATWEAQSKRQETVLAKTAEDFKKAQKEIENLAAENRRAGESLVEKEAEHERRLFEAKSEFERESDRRVKEAVESKTVRLAEALKSAEKKSEEAAAEAARTKEESVRLNADLLERVRQSEARIAREGEEAVGRRAAELEVAYKEKKAQLEASLTSVKAELEKEFAERTARQAAELEAKEQYLGSAQVKVKELERQLAGSNDAHHAELMSKMREKESEFRSRLEEFEEEKCAQLKCMEELKAGFTCEKAGLKSLLNERAAELEKEYAEKRESLAAELRGKEAELNREAAERIKFERATWEAQSRRQETLLAKTAEDFKKAQKEIEVLACENRKVSGLLLEKEGEFERRLLEAKADYEGELGRRVQEAVESKTGRLVEALKAAEKRSEGIAVQAALNEEEMIRTRAELAERARQYEERVAREHGEAAAKRAAEADRIHKERKLQLESAMAAAKAGLEKEFAERTSQQAEELAAKGESLTSAQTRVVELEKRLAGLNDAHRTELTEKMRGKEAELNREAEERIEFERAAWEAQSKRLESLLAKTAGDLKKVQKEIESLTAVNSSMSRGLAEKEEELARLAGEAGKERELRSKSAGQLNEAFARERERMRVDFAGQRAALEAELKERLAAFEEKEKSWAAEKERYEGESDLASEEARAFVAERAQKLKADFAKWKEALEKEYKEKIAVNSEALIFERDRLADELKRLKPEYSEVVKRAAKDHEELLRLAEQVRAKDALLISEKARLDKEFLEKHAAMEARFEGLKTEFELKDSKLRQSERKALAEKEALDADFSTRLKICENEIADWRSRAENSEKKWMEASKNIVELNMALKTKNAYLAELKDKFSENENRLAAEHAAMTRTAHEETGRKEAERRAWLEGKEKNFEERRKTLEGDYAAKLRQLTHQEKELEKDFASKKAGLIKAVDKIKSDLDRREAALGEKKEGPFKS